MVSRLILISLSLLFCLSIATYGLALEIQSVDPDYVPADSLPHEVTITGTGFTSSTSIYIDDGAQSVTYIGPTQLIINSTFYREGVFSLHAEDTCGGCDPFYFDDGITAISPPSNIPPIETPNCAGAIPNDGIDDHVAIKSCLSQQSITILGPGTYDIGSDDNHNAIVVTVDTRTLKSANNPDCRANASSCAVLKAMPGLVGPIIRNVRRDNFHIRSIIVDGNRANRTYNCPDSYRGDGSNIIINGSATDPAKNFTMNYSVDKETKCGSALEVYGQDIEIYNNKFINNGYPYFAGNIQPWADGVTLIKCVRTSTGPVEAVHDNLIKNSSDDGLVIGGGNNEGLGCIISANMISQHDQGAFYGLQLSYFTGGGGDFTSWKIQGNTITAHNSTGGSVDLGLCVGAHPFINQCIKNGLITDNTVAQAFVDLAIDGFSGGSVTGNTLNRTGTTPPRLFTCTDPHLPTKYTRGDYSNATLQDSPTPVSMVYHNSQCCVPGQPGCSIACP